MSIISIINYSFLTSYWLKLTGQINVVYNMSFKILKLHLKQNTLLTKKRVT